MPDRLKVEKALLRQMEAVSVLLVAPYLLCFWRHFPNIYIWGFLLTLLIISNWCIPFTFVETHHSFCIFHT